MNSDLSRGSGEKGKYIRSWIPDSENSKHKLLKEMKMNAGFLERSPKPPVDKTKLSLFLLT